MRIVGTDSSVFIFLDLLSTFFSWLSFTLHQVKCPSSERGFCRWCPWCPWWCPSSERGFLRLRCCRPPFSSETSSSANSRPRPQKPGLGNQLDDNLYVELKLNQPFKCAFQFQAGTNIAPRKTCFLHIMRKRKRDKAYYCAQEIF